MDSNKILLSSFAAMFLTILSLNMANVVYEKSCGEHISNWIFVPICFFSSAFVQYNMMKHVLKNRFY